MVVIFGYEIPIDYFYIILTNAIAIISGLLIILFGYILVKTSKLRIKIRKTPNPDLCTIVNNGCDFVFENRNDSKEYIPEYIISKRRRKKYITIKYNSKYDNIRYFVCCYKKKTYKPVAIYEISDSSLRIRKKTMRIHRKTLMVNIFVYEVNEERVEKKITVRKPNPLKLFFNPLFHSIILFLWLVIIYQLFCIVLSLNNTHVNFGSYFEKYYIKDIINMAILSGCSFIIYVIVLIIKRLRPRRVGKSYEFR